MKKKSGWRSKLKQLYQTKHKLQQNRNILYNLDLNCDKGWAFYQHTRYELIKLLEGVSPQAYDDVTGKIITPGSPIQGNITIGIGFNMDSLEALQIWNNVFDNQVNFQEAKRGSIILNPNQIQELTKQTIYFAAEYGRLFFESIYEYLRANELLVIELLCFNNPHKLVGFNTNFNKCMKLYYQKGDLGYLQEAVLEILHRSNPKKIPGIQNRRNVEAELLSSWKVPGYSLPD